MDTDKEYKVVRFHRILLVSFFVSFLKEVMIGEDLGLVSTAGQKIVRLQAWKRQGRGDIKKWNVTTTVRFFALQGTLSTSARRLSFFNHNWVLLKKEEEETLRCDCLCLHLELLAVRGYMLTLLLLRVFS